MCGRRRADVRTVGAPTGHADDWAGVIGRLEYANHVYYDRWFSKMDPVTRDWEVVPEIIAGPNTAITGPVEEFQRPLGYDTAPPGGAFVKIGVGVLKKPLESAAYSAFTSRFPYSSQM